MLVLSRKHGESVRIGADIEIIVTQVSSGKVRIGIVAPSEVPVLRSEICPPSQITSQHQYQPAATA